MKPHRAIASDGIIYVLDESTGFYEPETEKPLPYRGLIMVAGAILAWALFLGIAYYAWRVVEAISG